MNRDRDLYVNFIHKRIAFVEKQSKKLCSAFEKYSRSVSIMRDSGDSLEKVFKNYAEAENINKSWKEVLGELSKHFSKISIFCDLRIMNMSKNIVGAFVQYEILYKHSKNDVKLIYAAKKRKYLQKSNWMDYIGKIHRKNNKLNSEAELEKVNSEASFAVQNLEQKVIKFEKNKLESYKVLLLNFILYEIAFHGKALEILTKAYKDVKEIDELKDVEEFTKSLQEASTSNSSNKNETDFKNSLSSTALDFFSKEKRDNRSRDPGIPHFHIEENQSDVSQKNLKSEDNITHERETTSFIEENTISSIDFDDSYSSNIEEKSLLKN